MTTWIHGHSETLLALLLSIPVGLYLSFYSGLIVARWARFEDLRYELIRLLQSLEWPPGSNIFVLTGNYRAFDIVLISSDLLSLGHADAGNTVMKIANEVANELGRGRDFLTFEQLEEQFSVW